MGGLLPYLFGAMGGDGGGALVVPSSLKCASNSRYPGYCGRHEQAGIRYVRRYADKYAIREMIATSIFWCRSGGVRDCCRGCGSGAAFAAVEPVLLGIVVTGLFVAISMTAGGGAG